MRNEGKEIEGGREKKRARGWAVEGIREKWWEKGCIIVRENGVEKGGGERGEVVNRS